MVTEDKLSVLINDDILNAMHAVQRYLGHNDQQKWDYVCIFEHLNLSELSLHMWARSGKHLKKNEREPLCPRCLLCSVSFLIFCRVSRFFNFKFYLLLLVCVPAHMHGGAICMHAAVCMCRSERNS